MKLYISFLACCLTLTGALTHDLPHHNSSLTSRRPHKKQHHKAQVAVQNLLDTPITSVTVIHKYSSVYKNRQEWPIIESRHAGENPFEVDYNTGVGTPGVDWWFISWYSPDLKTIYYSDPKNFRRLVDKMEAVAPDVLVAASSAVGALLASASGPGAVAAGAAGAALAKAATNEIFNSESTEGFKQHTLRDRDAHKYVNIRIEKNGVIIIRSPSGESKTKYSSRPTRLEDKKKKTG